MYSASGAAFSELYHANGANGYDNLNRLKEFRRGTLTGTDTIADNNTTYRQVFTLDPVGNWTGFKQDAGDGSTWDLDQDRTHNLVNEITDITETTGPAWVTPAWCARGNMTSGPDVSDDTVKRHLIYDAWNRLVQVKADSSGSPGTLIAEYRYDALNRRIAKLIPNGENWNRTDYYYNNAWQVLDECYAANQANKDTPAANAKAQYVWSAKYIDSPVLRDDDTDQDGLCDDQRLYYLTDANFNVTALVGLSGGNWVAVERYIYTPYGKPTIYNSDWSATVTWANSKANEILYCGYRYDPETGLFHVRNRFYHPPIGRWMQRDPLEYVDGMSLYEYVWSAPTTWLDARGQNGEAPIIRMKQWSGQKAMEAAVKQHLGVVPRPPTEVLPQQTLPTLPVESITIGTPGQPGSFEIPTGASWVLQTNLPGPMPPPGGCTCDAMDKNCNRIPGETVPVNEEREYVCTKSRRLIRERIDPRHVQEVKQRREWRCKCLESNWFGRHGYWSCDASWVEEVRGGLIPERSVGAWLSDQVRNMPLPPIAGL